MKYFVLVLLAVTLGCALAQNVDLGGGFSVNGNGKGLQGTYRDSTFEVTLTCVREIDGSTVVKQADLTTATATSSVNHGDDGTGTEIEKTLVWTNPADAAGSLTWVHKLWKVQAFIESVEGGEDNVTVNAGDLKGQLTFVWDPEDFGDQLEVCVEVKWDIAEKDIVQTVIENGGPPEVEYNDIKDDSGKTIGFEISGDLNFKFYWPGKVRYERTINGTTSTTYGDATIQVQNLDKELEGKADLIITFDSIGNSIDIDPITNIAGDAAALAHLAILLLALLALFLAIFV
jgi:hypothetical protein